MLWFMPPVFKTLIGYPAKPEFAKKGTLRIVSQYSWLFSDKTADIVLLMYPENLK